MPTGNMTFHWIYLSLHLLKFHKSFIFPGFVWGLYGCCPPHPWLGVWCWLSKRNSCGPSRSRSCGWTSCPQLSLTSTQGWIITRIDCKWDQGVRGPWFLLNETCHRLSSKQSYRYDKSMKDGINYMKKSQMIHFFYLLVEFVTNFLTPCFNQISFINFFSFPKQSWFKG